MNFRLTFIKSYLVTISKALLLVFNVIMYHLSRINLIIKMNETISAKVILLKSCSDYLYTILQYWTCKFQNSLWNKVYSRDFCPFYQSILYFIIKSARNSWANQPKSQIIFKKRYHWRILPKGLWSQLVA